jgi:hypothetical protein
MIKHIAVTPYNTAESIGWVARNLFGFSRKNAGIVSALKSPHIFNPGVSRRYTVCFIGDIMPIVKSRLDADAGLNAFIKDSDYLVGNFEGTITEKPSAAWPIAFDQRHDRAIAGDLAAIFPPEKTYLSVSNNHAGDFHEEEFLKSVGILKSAGFNMFGWDKAPYADIGNDLRVVAGTMWSNRDFGYRLRIDNAKDHIKSGAFNILYPHMGYELELYPRPEIVKLAEEMAGSFDAVIAGHPHCPQPVAALRSGGIARPIAYSLGDFCCGLEMKKMRYSLVMKIEIGQDAGGRWAAGKAEWVYTECVRSSPGRYMVRMLPEKANPFK